jgi:hypothetical protein
MRHHLRGVAAALQSAFGARTRRASHAPGKKKGDQNLVPFPFAVLRPA